MKRQVVLLRVGIDSGCGGIQGPLFDDGSFDFVCIPDNKRVSVHTYGNLVGRDGRSHSAYFPKSRQALMDSKHVHFDPEFETFTYGDPTPPKRSLRTLRRGDLLVFYCGLQRWDAEVGTDPKHQASLYLAGYFEVALAGVASEFTMKVLKTEFAQNFHVRYPSVFNEQMNDLVLVKGSTNSRLYQKAHQISAMGQDRNGKPLKVLSPKMQQIFGTFDSRLSIQRSPPRWVDPNYAERAINYVTDLE